MTGDAQDVMLDAAKVLARYGFTDRHLRRLVVTQGYPSPIYVGERRRWWLSEVLAWEAANATRERPKTVRRGVANLLAQVKR
jgi:predicted DNA-binding transcriptional regulator AlpA